MKKIVSAKSNPVIIDACVLMVGINKQNTDSNYSFENMKNAYLQPLFNYLENIKIHEYVMEEIDAPRKDFIKKYIGLNVEIVSENGLYGKDPQYTTLFNNIAGHELFNYIRGESRNKGDVYSLAYATYYNIPFFSTRDGSIIKIMDEMPALSSIELLGFEYVLAIGYLMGSDKSKEMEKRLKSLYKSQCEPSIRFGLIPPTFSQYLHLLTE